MKRAWMLLLGVLLALIVAPVERAVSVFLPQQDSLAAQQTGEMEQLYGIRIEFACDPGAAGMEAGSLETLNLALQNVTPELVRYVSAHYEDKTGNPLTFRFTQPTADGAGDGRPVFAQFRAELALIDIYIPTAQRPAMMTGANPISIVHEFGHALHLLYADCYGAQRMREEWAAFNAGQEYDSGHLSANPDEHTFVSGYAATAYEEDVAETIGHVFVRHRAGQGFLGRLSKDGQLTGLGQKVGYIEQLLSSAEWAGDALQNYCRMYGAELSASYLGMSFSGDYLQFAGYPPPHNVLDAILDDLAVEAEEALWVEAVGAWHIRRKSEPGLLVFPGGTWCEVDSWSWQHLSAG